MRAGTLRHQVKLQRRVEGYDEVGQPSEGFETIATVWGSVEPLRGRDLFVARSEGSEVTHRVRTRWQAGVLPIHRIEHDGRGFIVVAPLSPEERMREFEFMCRELID